MVLGRQGAACLLSARECQAMPETWYWGLPLPQHTVSSVGVLCLSVGLCILSPVCVLFFGFDTVSAFGAWVCMYLCMPQTYLLVVETGDAWLYRAGHTNTPLTAQMMLENVEGIQSMVQPSDMPFICFHWLHTPWFSQVHWGRGA